MALNINISEIFYKAFGYEMPEPEQPEIPNAAARLDTSSLGQAYYANDDLGREHYLPLFINDMLIPFAIVGVTAKKTIVNTPMPERGGTVHELISIDDYVFTIKGIFINDSNDYPEQNVKDLFALFQVNQSVVMRGVLPAIFLNGNFEERVIISEVRFPQVQGIENAVPFEMICESDMAFELEIK